MSNALGAITELSRINSASSSTYVSTDLGIRRSDDETKNLISNTYGNLKRDQDAPWFAEGLNKNVTLAFQNLMNDPDSQITYRGQTYMQHPAVGDMHPYTDDGEPSKGSFTVCFYG